MPWFIPAPFSPKELCGMKNRMIFCAVLLSFAMPVGSDLNAQQVQAEVLGSHEKIWYQHTVTKTAAEGTYGYFHASSFHQYFDPASEFNELMSQSYVTWGLLKSVRAGAGYFYTNIIGLRPSVMFQISHARRDLFLLVAPRVDIAQYPTFELFLLAQYAPMLSEKFGFYTRLQMMSSTNLKVHGRSYQYLRLGIRWDRLKAGLGLNFDEYGPAKFAEAYPGVFINADF